MKAENYKLSKQFWDGKVCLIVDTVEEWELVSVIYKRDKPEYMKTFLNSYFYSFANWCTIKEERHKLHPYISFDTDNIEPGMYNVSGKNNIKEHNLILSPLNNELIESEEVW